MELADHLAYRETLILTLTDSGKDLATRASRENLESRTSGADKGRNFEPIEHVGDLLIAYGCPNSHTPIEDHFILRLTRIDLGRAPPDEYCENQGDGRSENHPIARVFVEESNDPGNNVAN